MSQGRRFNPLHVVENISRSRTGAERELVMPSESTEVSSGRDCPQLVQARSGGLLRITVLICLCALLVISARAQTPSLGPLYAFTGTPDGARPAQSNLVLLNGTLYGTTSLGGAYGYGTIFKLSTVGKETILYNFTGGTDGAYPSGGLFPDKNGDFFGTAQNGGNLSCISNSLAGCGVVYTLNSAGQFSVLYTFSGGSDGAWPQGLVRDSAGNLYGATQSGGDLNCGITSGCGVVYKLDLNLNQSVLHTFEDDASGTLPNGYLFLDSAGNLYGTTIAGGNLAGCLGAGCGVVYKLNTSGSEIVLYTFSGGTDGGSPNGGLLLNSLGNLYGTTYAGGNLTCSNAGSVGCGVIFEITPSGAEFILHPFAGGRDGANPTFGLVRDASGNEYATTVYGGTGGSGTIYELPASGHQRVAYSFTGRSDGGFPESGLTVDPRGYLYGNTTAGGNLTCNPPSGCGTVFKFKP
jgi:uncharacterized repeat protein (TIGR03803 family)